LLEHRYQQSVHERKNKVKEDNGRTENVGASGGSPMESASANGETV